MSECALELRDLEVRHRDKLLVDGVSLRLVPGMVTALVGESGSGKSLTARAILGVLPDSLHVTVGGLRIGDVSHPLRPAAGRSPELTSQLAWIPQDPRFALHPTWTVLKQLRMLSDLRGLPADADREFAVLREAGLPDAERVGRLYPHELSGGMAQRVSLALALITEPNFLIADEPTSALDPIRGTALLKLLTSVANGRRMGLLLITHDLDRAWPHADQLVVMLGGRVMEMARMRRDGQGFRHPYTRHLLDARLSVAQLQAPAEAIQVGSTGDNAGCPFAPRCSLVEDRCRTSKPTLISLNADEALACPPEADRLGPGSPVI